MDINRADREHAAKVVNFFWGRGTATPETVNESVIRVAVDALDQANVCSDSMDLVPRPAGIVRPDPKWAMKQIRKVAQRINEGNTSVYHICKVRIESVYKTEIRMALEGLI
ncbi:hypothetical protein GCM10007392_20190 [Saccharospirillum salsuginis]|uniref:Uncharacterized protein n=1 Tax=Saccharospirillum salsuginis TaxID=418750 RepID=A0A918K706_9GAMM|nr:hypothetical protein GCM10007392_20190 [Saccharospirillum salsuginis]